MDLVPEEFRHLPQVDIFLENGDELVSLLLDLSKTSNEELIKILENEGIFADVFHDCVKYDTFSIKRRGNKVYIWPKLQGEKVKLFPETN